MGPGAEGGIGRRARLVTPTVPSRSRREPIRRALSIRSAAGEDVGTEVRSSDNLVAEELPYGPGFEVGGQEVLGETVSACGRIDELDDAGALLVSVESPQRRGPARIKGRRGPALESRSLCDCGTIMSAVLPPPRADWR